MVVHFVALLFTSPGDSAAIWIKLNEASSNEPFLTQAIMLETLHFGHHYLQGCKIRPVIQIQKPIDVARCILIGLWSDPLDQITVIGWYFQV